MNSFFHICFAYFILIFIISIVGSIFYKIKCGTIPPFKWFNSIITLTATVLTPILAVAAYDSWKKTTYY
jgi:hypothetical protein